MTMRAGFACIDITPDVPCELNGFAAREQPARRVAMPLKARALLIEDGRRRALLGVCDVLGFTLANARRLEETMAAAAGVPARNAVVICTHTHSGPMSMPLGNVGAYEVRCVARVAKRLAEASRGAAADLAETTGARMAQRAVPALGFFRCAADEPGRKRWPGALNVLCLERRGAPDILLTHLGAHALCLGHDNRAVHPDYPGALCGLLANDKRHALFLPACGADVHPSIAEQPKPAAAEDYAALVAREVERALRSAESIPAAPLRCSQRTLDLRFAFRPDLTAEQKAALTSADAPDRARRRMAANTRDYEAAAIAGRLPTRARCRMRIVRLGGVVLACLPCEVFCDTGVDLASDCPEARLLVVSQAGGDLGYLPRAFAYRRLTYEVASAQEWYRTDGALRPDSEARVRAVVHEAAARLMR